MLKYACTNCSYVYNPFIGDEQNPEGTFFDTLDESWICPHCGEWKEYFQEIPENFQEISNLSHSTESEIKHIPFYTERANEVVVRIGTPENPHPRTENHFIEYVGLFETDGELIDIKIQPDEDIITFENPGLDEYEVRSSCNLHGVWRGMKIQ